MSYLHCFVALAVLGSTLAFTGQYVPKSFYTIDENGDKSDVIYFRKSFAPRSRRSPAGVDYSGSIAYDGPAEIARQVESGLGNTFQKLRSLASEVGSNSGGGAYSGSFSSGGVSGPGLAGEGPVLYSRFAERGGGSEKELVTGGNGQIHASANAQGPNGGYSFSSSSVDSNGKVQYKTQARQF